MTLPRRIDTAESSTAKKSVSRRRRIRTNDGVSEVIGTVFLVGIGVSLFSVLIMLVFNTTVLFESGEIPASNIVVHYDGSGLITFENRGGDPIPLDSTITLTFANIAPIQFTLRQFLSPPPGPTDSYWTMGERVIYNASAVPNLNILQIQAVVFDTHSNSILMRGLIQEGVKEAAPNVITDPPVSVSTRQEHFYLEFDYQIFFPHAGWQYWVRFSYKTTSSGTWSTTAWYNETVKSGSYDLIVSTLQPGTSYMVKAEACWGLTPSTSTMNYTSGSVRQFTTPTNYVGLWHFNEQIPPTDPSLIVDATINHNNGTLSPTAQPIRPVRTSNGVNGSAGIVFDGVNDYATIPDSTSLRTFGNETQVECWVKPQNHSEGYKGYLANNDISHFCQYLENYSANSTDVIWVSGQYYAMVSRGANGHGYLATVSITNKGIINAANLTSCIVSLLDFDSSCFKPRITYVSGTVYAILYSRGGSTFDKCSGYLKTVNILGTGVIGSVIGNLSIPATYFSQPRILRVTGSVFSILYNTGPATTNSYRLYVKTVTIPTIGNPTNISLFYLSTLGSDQTFVPVGNSSGKYYFTIAYHDTDNDGYMMSINISSTGTIMNLTDQNPDPNITAYNIGFDSDGCYYPDMIPVASTGQYVIVYTGEINNTKNFGLVRTFKISTLGIISSGTYEYSQDFKVIDGSASPANLVFGTPRIIPVNTTTYVIAYQYLSSTYYGLVQTIKISSTGNITYVTHPAPPPGVGTNPNESRRFTFESSYGCLAPVIIRIQAATNPYTFAVFYSRATNLSNQGMIKTFNISTDGTIIRPCIRQALLGSRHLYNPYLFLLNGIYYAMVYNTEYNVGLTVTTFKITAAGDVNDALIDSVSLSSDKVLSVKMLQIKNNVFCLAYYDYTLGVVIRRINITTGSGIIDKTSDRIWSRSTSLPCTVGFVKISDVTSNDIYAISYHTTAASVGTFVCTVHISNSGVVTGPISRLNMTDSTYLNTVYDTSLTRLQNSVGGSSVILIMTFSWSWSNSYGNGQIITMKIDVASGIITTAPLKVFVFDNYIIKATIVQVSNMVYTLAYTYWNSVDRISTVKISNDGITISVVDPGPSAANYCSQILPINPANLVYAAVAENGIVRTFRINGSGDISVVLTGGSSQFYDNMLSVSNCKYLRAVQISSTVYAFVYAGLYNDPYVRTLTITVSKTKGNVFLRSGSFNISADDSNVYVVVTDAASGLHSLTAPLSYTSDWNYIVCSYKIGQTMKLYLNGGNFSSHRGRYRTTNETMTRSVAAPSISLVIGGYNAVYEEFAISNKIMSGVDIKSYYSDMIS